MGKRLEAVSDDALRRAARDPRLTPAARRAVEKELARRERSTDNCPNGRGCSDWRCEKEH